MTASQSLPDTERAVRDRLLARLYAQDHPWLLGRLYDRLRNREDAEDIAGEAFSQLVGSPLLEHVNEPRALLTTVAKRVMWKLWRRRELEAAWLESLRCQAAGYAPSAQEQMEIMQALQCVDAILQDLPHKARVAFVYSQVDGMRHAEIAAELQVSVSTVRYYIAQGMRRCVAAQVRP
ncbi:sigma factor-like helix-turn-helix DNA-binding protein [Corticimicrobacter populi]|uniref:RNA polymerase subunit sigma n=1 Tax=Corticimicrobacter populi TaxID=2175229 RepID=A0A2V1JXP3_9BURK|nr:sigma factor-like helix-turn-helix DNA-binding protein [Corticimicrobacter populi]PWF20908.1 RNA polymerase subunit sigma [Corticimicrobacter populi]